MATLGEYISKGSGTTKLLLHLNGNSTDDSGNSNNGTDTSITYSQANGRFGQGAGFNGTSSKIDLGDVASLEGLTEMTISVWFKTTLTSSGALLQKELVYQTAVVASGLVNTAIGNGGSWVGGPSSTYSVKDGKWYNLVFTFSDTNNIGIIYINGLLNNSSTINISMGTNTIQAGVGARFSGSWGDYFNGSIDEVILENVVWTPAQIAKYYTMTKGRFGIL